MFWLVVVINPIRFLVLAALLCTLSCGYSRYTECKFTLSLEMVQSFLSPFTDHKCSLVTMTFIKRS